jgi:hypothetical protein
VSLRPGTRLRILGGSPTPEQIAALVLAVDQLLAEKAPGPPQPGWQRAARVEGLGGAPLESSRDARLARARTPTER